jgi:hypothetical protein
MVSELVRLIASCGRNGIIRADKGTHAAADTGVGRVGFLPNAVVDGKNIAGCFGQVQGRLDGTFTKDTQLHSTYRADRRAATAERALVLAPEYLPRQIFYA